MHTQDTTTALDTLIEGAIAHLKKFGGRVLPTVATTTNPKLPMLRGGCLSAAPHPGAVRELFSRFDEYVRGLRATGYAYYPAEDIVVIDRDVKNGKDGRADTDYVAKQIGCALPETATVLTPSGGDHLYFRLPPGVVLPHGLMGKVGRGIRDAEGKLHPTGVDIFSYHETKSFWVAGPGTVTPKGKYEWQRDNADVAMLPKVWVDHIIAARPPKPPRDPSQPRPERESVPLSYITSALGAIDPADLGHDSRFTVRAVIMDAAVLDGAAGAELPEEDKIELLREWCARNPRFDDDAFNRSINSILAARDDDGIHRAGLGSLDRLARERGYAGPAPSIALANAKIRGLFKHETISTEPPVLLATAPVDSAREMLRRQFSHDDASTLVRSQGEFHRWNGRSYVTVTKERMDAEIYRFLDGAFRKDREGTLLPFNPLGKHADEVSRALAAQTHTPDGAVAPCWLDGRPAPDPKQLLAVGNGLLNLTTRELLPHTPAFFNANALDFNYDATALRPNWDRFLSQVYPDDQQVVDAIQEMFGLMLTGDTSYQKAFMLIGPPRSGKGTIGRVLTAMLGNANVCSPKLSGVGGRFGMASLIGKRAAIVADAQLGNRADPNAVAENVLSLTGEDSINVERKNKEDWIGRLQTRLLLMANELPKITNTSGALASRFIIMTGTQDFRGKEDLGLEERLLLELSGILIWALDGLARLRARGRFVQPQSSLDAAQEMEHLGSPLKTFLHEVCVVGKEHTVDKQSLYQAYVTWFTASGGKYPPAATVFGRDLKAAVPGLNETRVGPRGDQTRRYQGVGLRSETAAPSDDVIPLRRRRTYRPEAASQGLADATTAGSA